MTSTPPPRRVLWTSMTAGALLVGLYGVALVASGFALLPDEVAANDFGVALRVHVATASLALLLGPWQFSRRLRRSRPRLHRCTGRAYVATGVVAGVTGVLAAPFTASGPVAGAGFLVLGIAWVAATVLALRAARHADLVAHRRWAVRSFALAYAAVVLRLQVPLAMSAGLTFEQAYPVIAWTCWIPNLLIAERLVRHRGVVPVGPARIAESASRA